MKTITITLFLFFSCFAFSQVGVGNTDPKSTLDISASSTTSPTNEDGILIPRIDNFPTTNPTADQDGMMVFYTGTSLSGKGFYYWDNGSGTWVAVGNNTNDSDWLELGTYTVPDDINDNIYHLGQIRIGSSSINPAKASIVSTVSENRQGLANYHSGSDASDIGYALYNQSNISDIINYTNFYNVNSGTHNSLHWGIRNYFNNNGTGTKYGLENEFDYTAPNGQKIGVSNRFEGGNSETIGVQNSFPGAWTITGNIRGIYNLISAPGNGQHYGLYSSLFGSGSGNKYGTYSSLSGSGTGDQYGNYVNISNSESGTHYGSYNYLTGTGAGYKYGVYSQIHNSAGGIHYGVWSAVDSPTGYAGYFIGRTSLGDSVSNRYLMPAADGTAGQVMTTDGAGNVTFQNVTGDGDTQNTLDQAYDEGGVGAGKNITADNGAVRINGDDGFLVTGTFGSGDTIDSEITGEGTRMFFNPSKAAFRAGYAEEDRWDDTNIGDYSFAVSRRSQASGFASVSLGYDSEAIGDFSIAMGNNSGASHDYALMIGLNCFSYNNAIHSFGFGNSAETRAPYSFAFGQYVDTYGDHSMAKGLSLIARSYGETVLGFNNSDYTANSTNSYNANDRLFVLGNGIDSSNRSNALTIYKDGLMNINDEYNMPLADGTANQVMTTDGAGNITFQDLPIYTDTDEQDLSSNIVTVNEEIEITITNGTSTTINIQDADANSTNEIITAAVLSGTDLEITEAGSTTTIDLSSLQDGDTQNTLDQAYDEGGAGAGKNITADSGALRINGDDGFLVTGTLGSGNFIDSEVTGVGTRMFFNPNKAAFRAGYVSTNQWDNTNIGSYSVAFGSGTTASGEVSSAFGAFTIASGQFSMASGAGTTASGQTAIASGTSTTASGDYSTAFGYSTLASGNYSTVFGNDNTASGRYSSVFGNSNTAPSAYETVIGINSTNYTPNSTTSFNNNDRLFVVGNGSMPTMRSNALTIYKDGRMTINDAYTMPTIDGTAGQVMTTDGAGNVTFQDIVGDGDTQNTLDQAYNEGGSGAGNTITANAGAVTIDGTDGILVTGILGSGATISSSTVNPTMFFNPRTGSFRSGTSSGTSWDASNTGTLSVAFGSGNTASGYTSTAIGISNVASGARAFSGGSNSISSGLDSFAFGLECTANATGSVSMGVDNTSHSLGEFTVGTYSTNYTAFDTFTWNINDRIFSVGNGSSTSARSNALTIYKSGEVNINDAYSLPTSDGTNGQVMTTDGAGNVTFQNPMTNTDDQQVDNLGLVGTVLGISLEDDGVAPVTVDLASINTDNQQIDNFSFNSTTNILTLEIEDDGQVAQTADLSSLNPTKSVARIYMLNSQSETNGGTTKVNFDTVDFDINSNFNTTTDEFTVPTDGIYRVTAQITLDSSTATGVFGVRIRVDGTQERRSEYNHHGNGELVRQVTSILNLTAGQTIDVAFVRPAVGATINQNARATFFEIEQL